MRFFCAKSDNGFFLWRGKKNNKHLAKVFGGDTTISEINGNNFETWMKDYTLEQVWEAKKKKDKK